MRKTRLRQRQKSTGESTCDHTLYLLNSQQRQQGSWINQRVGSLVRVVCGVCGKFYGYRPHKQIERSGE